MRRSSRGTRRVQTNSLFCISSPACFPLSLRRERSISQRTCSRLVFSSEQKSHFSCGGPTAATDCGGRRLLNDADDSPTKRGGTGRLPVTEEAITVERRTELAFSLTCRREKQALLTSQQSPAPLKPIKGAQTYYGNSESIEGTAQSRKCRSFQLLFLGEMRRQIQGETTTTTTPTPNQRRCST